MGGGVGKARRRRDAAAIEWKAAVEVFDGMHGWIDEAERVIIVLCPHQGRSNAYRHL